MEYENGEGNKLYGFSVKDMDKLANKLDQNTKVVERANKVQIAWLLLAILVVILLVALFFYADTHNWYSNFVARCVC